MGNSPPTTPVRPASYKDTSTQTPTRTPVFAAASTRIPAWKRGTQPSANPASYSSYMAIQQGRSLLAGIDLNSPSPSTNATSPVAPSASAAKTNLTASCVTENIVASSSTRIPNVTPNIVDVSRVNSSNVAAPIVNFTALPAPCQVTLSMRVLFQRQPDSFNLGEGQILVGIAGPRPPPAGDIHTQLLIDIWQKSNELGRPPNYHCRRIDVRWERDPFTIANTWLQDREIGNAEALERVIRVIHRRRMDGMMGDVLVAWFNVE